MRRLLKYLPQPMAGLRHRLAALSTRPTQKKKPWFMPSQREVIAGVPAVRSFSA